MLIRFAIAALALVASAPAAYADDTLSFSTAVIPLYAPTRADEREAVLQRLQAVCHSSLASEQARCRKAWGIIRAAKAQLDAQRAAGVR